jgi:3-oxoacyl-(acyl-carrier-protein) synthase
MNDRRVVITGMGVISPVGNDLNSFWDSLKAGRSGISRITAFDTSAYHCHIAGEVRNFDYVPFFRTPKDGKRVDRYAGLAVAASRMALEDSGISHDSIDPTRVGVMVGSGIGGLTPTTGAAVNPAVSPCAMLQSIPQSPPRRAGSASPRAVGAGLAGLWASSPSLAPNRHGGGRTHPAQGPTRPACPSGL